MNFHLIPAAERAAEGGAVCDPAEGGAPCCFSWAAEGGGSFEPAKGSVARATVGSGVTNG